MINVVALFLVLSSLVTAALWSPTPPETHPNPPTQDVIAKTGHQKLIVEFDKEDGNTKVSISPQESHISPVLLEGKCFVLSAKDELPTATTKGAAAVEDSRQKVQGALDRCRDKATEVEERAKEAAFEALIKAKDSVERKTGEALSKAGEVKDEAKDVIREASEKGKERASERAWEVKEAVGDATERAKETVTEKAQEAKEVARDVTQKAKEKVSEKAQEEKEKASEKAQEEKEKASEKAQEAKEAVGDVTQKAKEKVSEKAQEVRERLSEATQKEKERMAATAYDVMEEGEKDLNEILRRGREVGYDVLVYVVSPRTVEPAAGVVHLLGFAAAYGMCLWVTFVSSYVLAGAMDRQQFGVVQSKIYPVYFRTMAYCVGLALFAHLLGHRKRMLANYMGVEVFLGYNLLVSLMMILFNLLYLEPRATKVMIARTKLEKEEGRGRESSISEPISKAAADPTADSAGIPARGADATSTTPFSKEGRGRETSISEPSRKSAADSAAIPAHGADAPSAPPLRPEELEQVAARAQIVELSERLKKLNAYSSFLNILTLMHLTWHLVYLGQHLHVAC